MPSGPSILRPPCGSSPGAPRSYPTALTPKLLSSEPLRERCAPLTMGFSPQQTRVFLPCPRAGASSALPRSLPLQVGRPSLGAQWAASWATASPPALSGAQVANHRRPGVALSPRADPRSEAPPRPPPSPSGCVTYEAPSGEVYLAPGAVAGSWAEAARRQDRRAAWRARCPPPRGPRAAGRCEPSRGAGGADPGGNCRQAVAGEREAENTFAGGLVIRPLSSHRKQDSRSSRWLGEGESWAAVGTAHWTAHGHRVCWVPAASRD